jgi:hypothetical protein
MTPVSFPAVPALVQLPKPNEHIQPRHAVGDVIHEEDREGCEEERAADQFVSLAVIGHERGATDGGTATR